LVEGAVLTLAELDEISSELSLYKPGDILNKYGEIVKGREDVLLTGTIILRTIIHYFGAEEIMVSGRGIRYGAVVDFMNSHF